MVNDIEQIAISEFITINTGKSLIGNLTSNDDFRALAKEFINNKTPFHIYEDPKNKPRSVGIKYIIIVADIKEELNQNHQPILLLKINRINYKDRPPMPVVIVE